MRRVNRKEGRSVGRPEPPVASATGASPMSDRVIVFDTTLRDGEQSAGVLFTERDKLDIAEKLASMRVDVIEAGFPAASPTEFRAVHAVARQVRTASICGLARCV